VLQNLLASPLQDAVLHIAILPFKHFNIRDSVGSKGLEADAVDVGLALWVRFSVLHMLVHDYHGDIQEGE